jgi:AraC-like DNA-binding protein/quercetin dioxygenase-like cupin family protein
MRKKGVPVDRLKGKNPVNPFFGVRTDFSAGSRLDFHKHEFFEIIYVLSEGCIHQFESKEYKVAPGTLIFVPPYVVHRMSIPNNAKVFIVYFDATFPKPLELGDAADVDLISVRKHPEFAPFIFHRKIDFMTRGSDRKKITALFETLAAESRGQRIGYLELQRSALRFLLLSVVRLYENEIQGLIQKNAQHEFSNDVIFRILKFIQANLYRKISLDDVAKEVFLTSNYVSHLISRETDKTFSALILEKRIEHAKELLRFTSKRLVEIAEEVGFPDETYFSKRFKLYTGETPKKFRDSII